MSGKKGRSGRRPMTVEMKRRAIIDKAWDVYEQGLDGALPLKVKMENAAKVVVKDMPQEIKASFQVTDMPVIRLITGEAEPKELEFNIGNSRRSVFAESAGEATSLN